MIYICYGITKSASTFLYQMTEEVFRVAGRAPVRLGKPFRPLDSLDNYFNFVDHELLGEIERHVGERDIVLKTHGTPCGDTLKLIADGKVLASASIRDPREIALSLLDHGERSRHAGVFAFSEFVTLQDTLHALDLQLGAFREWTAVDRVKVFTYNDISYDSAAVVRAVADQIGVKVDDKDVLARFRSKGSIGQFSKGKALRYSEMSDADQAIFLERFADIYANHAFDNEAARQVAIRQASQNLRPTSEFAQRITNLRRRFRI